MKKNYIDKVNRKAFIQLAIDNPVEAADILRKRANELSKCKNTTQSICKISECLFLSDRTIYNDYLN